MYFLQILNNKEVIFWFQTISPRTIPLGGFHYHIVCQLTTLQELNPMSTIMLIQVKYLQFNGKRNMYKPQKVQDTSLKVNK